MPGGLLQLVAYGAPDIFLTGNPQITFFKMVFKRYTNFAMEFIDLPFSSLPTFSQMSKKDATCIIGRNGDLLGEIYLIYELPSIKSTKKQNFKWIRNIGVNLIDEISLYIGGQLIDKHDNNWLNIDETLKGTNKPIEAYNRLIGNTEDLYNPNINNEDEYIIKGRKLYIPLKFWFCLDSGLSLPLISLQYIETEIRVKFNELNKLFTLGSNNESPAKYIQNNNFSIESGLNEFILNDWKQDTYLMAKYIFIDDSERKIYANNTHEYLIPQVQHQYFGNITNGNNILEPKIYLPVKILHWVFIDQEEYINYNILNKYNNIMDKGTIFLNGIERASTKDAEFFSTVNQYRYFKAYNPGIYSYVLCLDPLNIKPTGSLNFSRINNVELHYYTNNDKENDLHLYAVNYNILRIMNGLAGLVFST